MTRNKQRICQVCLSSSCLLLRQVFSAKKELIEKEQRSRIANFNFPKLRLLAAANLTPDVNSLEAKKHRHFFHGAAAPSRPGPPHYPGLTITLRHTTLGRTPLDG
jgi:hypothetical protein